VRRSQTEGRKRRNERGQNGAEERKRGSIVCKDTHNRWREEGWRQKERKRGRMEVGRKEER
jgi:hypothetical protein